MTALTAGPASIETVSPTLWATWFDKGLLALGQHDFTGAVTWLHEAVQHVCATGPDEKRHAMTEANLAYAYLLQARKWVRQAENPCTTECHRKELCEFAEKSVGRANAYATSALTRLVAFDNNWPALNLATARAAHVNGELCYRAGDLGVAVDRFKVALSYYLHFPQQVAALDDVYLRLYTVCYQTGDFEKGLVYLAILANRATRRNERTWLAQLLAAQADSLIQVGRYRDAWTLYERWKALAPDCAGGTEDDYPCAYALAAFGRAHLILGYYDEAYRLLARSDTLIECLLECRYTHPSCIPPYDGTLRFDVALLRAELELKRGDLRCARELLALAAAMHPAWNDRRIRLCLVTGQLNFALGCFPEACVCFAEARRLAECTKPARLVLLIPALLGLSRVEGETSNWSASMGLASLAVHLLEQAGHVVSAELAWALQTLAIAYVRDDRSQEALPLCEKGHHLMIMALRANHPDEAELQLTIAEHYISRRNPQQAIDACSRADTLSRQYSCHDGFARARMLRIEGEAHQVHRHVDCALHFFNCARTVWHEQEACLGCDHPEESLILLDIAVAKVSQGNTKIADECFKILKPMLCQFKGNAARAGFELNRRGNLFLLLQLYAEAEWLFCHAEEYYCECYGVNHEFTCQVRANRETANQRRAADCAPLMIDCR